MQNFLTFKYLIELNSKQELKCNSKTISKQIEVELLKIKQKNILNEKRKYVN